MARGICVTQLSHRAINAVFVIGIDDEPARSYRVSGTADRSGDARETGRRRLGVDNAERLEAGGEDEAGGAGEQRLQLNSAACIRHLDQTVPRDALFVELRVPPHD